MPGTVLNIGSYHSQSYKVCTVSILIIERGNWSLEKLELTCPGLTAINCQSRWQPGALFQCSGKEIPSGKKKSWNTKGAELFPRGCLAASQGQTALICGSALHDHHSFSMLVFVYIKNNGVCWEKKYSHKRKVTPYSLCAVTSVKIDTTMSFLMQNPLASLPSRCKQLNQKHLSTVIKLSPLRLHSLPLFWPLPGRNYLNF